MTELLPEKELVTRALASSRDGVGSAIQLHASHAHVTPWLWAGWKSNVLCLGFPIFSKQTTWVRGSGTGERGRA